MLSRLFLHIYPSIAGRVPNNVLRYCAGRSWISEYSFVKFAQPEKCSVFEFTPD